MDRNQFIRGWILLTTQPWGKPYRTQIQSSLTGEPDPADVQLQLYFNTLKDCDAVTWVKACEQYAQGDHWPSLDQLKLTLKALAPKPKALPAPEVKTVSMAEAFAEAPALAARLVKLLGRELS